VALLGFLASGPVLGLVAGVLTAGALFDRRVRGAVAAVPVVALAGVAAYVALKQHRNGYSPGVEWPNNFHAAQWWVVLAVVCVVAATAAEAWATARERRRPGWVSERDGWPGPGGRAGGPAPPTP
jgi:hypothetical protein